MTIDLTIVRHLTFGRPRAPRGTVSRARLDVGGTRLRLRALHVMGHGSARIARALGVREETIQRLVRGDARGDNEHTGRAILLISDLAHIYEGSLDHPFGPYINGISPSRTEPAPPEPGSQDAALVPAGDVKTLLAALYIAADYKRDRP